MKQANYEVHSLLSVANFMYDASKTVGTPLAFNKIVSETVHFCKIYLFNDLLQSTFS